MSLLPAERRRVGSWHESRIVHWLKAKQVQIVGTNIQCSHLELDVVGMDGDELVFFEVRSRCDDYFGSAASSVIGKKLLRLERACRYFLHQHAQYENTPYRIDVIGIDKGKIAWYKNVSAG